LSQELSGKYNHTNHSYSYAGMYIVCATCPTHEAKTQRKIAAVHHQTLLRTPEPPRQPGQNRNRERRAHKRLCVRVPTNRPCPSTSFFRQLGLTAVLIQLTTIETYPQMIGYDTEVYEYFKEQYAYHTVSFPPWYLNLDLCSETAFADTTLPSNTPKLKNTPL